MKLVFPREIRDILSCGQRWGEADLTFSLVTEEEVTMAAREMSTGKAAELDGIPPEAVKALASNFPSIFAAFFNGILVRGDYPRAWKYSKVVLIPKERSSPNAPPSYRPLSIIDAMPKLFEYVLRSRIMELIVEDGFLKHQFGFRKERSTMDALRIVHEFIEAAAIKQWYAVLISLDVKNAFNCMKWNIVAEEMRRRDFPMYLRKILISYFQGREVEVQATDRRDRRAMFMRVPQGSVIGPILWDMVYDGLLNRSLR